MTSRDKEGGHVLCTQSEGVQQNRRRKTPNLISLLHTPGRRAQGGRVSISLSYEREFSSCVSQEQDHSQLTSRRNGRYWLENSKTPTSPASCRFWPFREDIARPRTTFYSPSAHKTDPVLYPDCFDSQHPWSGADITQAVFSSSSISAGIYALTLVKSLDH